MKKVKIDITPEPEDCVLNLQNNDLQKASVSFSSKKKIQMPLLRGSHILFQQKKLICQKIVHLKVTHFSISQVYYHLFFGICFQKHISEEDFLCNFCDGAIFQNNLLFQSSRKFSKLFFTVMNLFVQIQ